MDERRAEGEEEVVKEGGRERGGRSDKQVKINGQNNRKRIKWLGGL